LLRPPEADLPPPRPPRTPDRRLRRGDPGSARL